MPASRKVEINPAILIALQASKTNAEIGAMYGCAESTIRRYISLEKSGYKPTISDAIPMGRGGDRAFDAGMGERRFEDHPALRQTPGMPRLWPHITSHGSLTGSSAAWSAE